MKPLKQRFRHDPDNGIWGDCHRAAIASIFELPLDEVPHFLDKGVDSTIGAAAQDAWLATRKMGSFSVAFDIELIDLLEMMAINATDVFWILGGTSRNQVNHSVVACGGLILHDPSLDNSGIVAPCNDGHYWVTVFTSFRDQAATGGAF